MNYLLFIFLLEFALNNYAVEVPFRIATQQQVDQGTNATAAVTPKTLAHSTAGGSNSLVSIFGSVGNIATNESTLQVGFTGTLLMPILADIPPMVSVALATTTGNTSLTPIRGVWANSLMVAGESANNFLPGLLSLTFSNLVGTTGNGFNQISGLPRITSLSFPALVYSGSPYMPNIMPLLTELLQPNLVYAATNIAPNTMAALPTLDFPSLTIVHGIFNPNTMAALTNLGTPLLTSAVGYGPATMAGLKQLTAPLLNYCGASGFIPTAMGTVTNVSFPVLTNVNGPLQPSSMALCRTLNFPVLETVSTFTPTSMAALTNVVVTNFRNCGQNFNPSTLGALQTLQFPALTNIGGTFQPTTMGVLTNFSFPVLRKIGSIFAPTTMALLGSLSFPALTNVNGGGGGSFSITGMAALTNVSMPVMIDNVSTTITMTNALGNLTTVTLGTVGTLKSMTGASINIKNQKLDQATVNGILALLVSLDGTGGTTTWGSGKSLDISGGTSSAPSGQGATDKTTLQGRGATITTN